MAATAPKIMTSIGCLVVNLYFTFSETSLIQVHDFLH